MPAKFIGELILRVIFEFVFFVGFYYLGRVVVPCFSFGRIKCDRLTAENPRRKLRWGGSFHRRGQQVFLTAETTAAVGFIFIAIPAAAVLLIFYW